MAMRGVSLLLPLAAVVIMMISLSEAGLLRQKRMAFNFQNNTGSDGSNVDWDSSAVAPTLKEDVPDTDAIWAQDDQTNSYTTSARSETPLADPIPINNEMNREFRTDCPPHENLCLYIKPCNDSQECAMDLECRKIVCVDRQPKTTPTPVPATTSPGHRWDCPPHENLCLYFTICSDSQECAMDLECRKIVCVDRQPKTTPTPVPTTTSPEYRWDCPSHENLCLSNKPCSDFQECAMDLECKRIVCVDYKPEAVPQVGGDGNSSEKPSICRKGSYYTSCVHGHCGEEGCVCDEGWQDTKCDRPCKLDCVYGNCFIDYYKNDNILPPPEQIDETYWICNCQHGWQGKLCDQEIPDLVDEAEKRTLRLGISLGCALLMVVVVSVITMVILWQKRVIVVMKLVYFFKMEEDDDGRLYDAYVSMGSSYRGIDFVQKQLCPKLEGHGFRVYVQARDQLVGEALSDSILNAMAQSRRTILIITPDYLENEWSKFEYMIAQIETLKLQQRIIPIVLEDISAERKNMNKTLKHIMDSVKCLKFPKPNQDYKYSSLKKVETLQQKNKEKKFWKRLQLTMPKKKSVTTNDTKSHLCFDTKKSELEFKTGKSLEGTFNNIYSLV